MKHIAAAIGVLVALTTTTARADTITDWNQTAIAVMKTANVTGNPWTRHMAMVHVAMSDAVNSVQGKYTRYVAKGELARDASAEAAASSAARQILLEPTPIRKRPSTRHMRNRSPAFADGPAKTAGIALGEQIAKLVRDDRAADGTSAPDTYRPITTPGVWVPTAPPIFAQYAQAKPWVLKSADQFRPGPPPQLTSAIYARDYNETKNVGGAKSTARTAEQSDAVKFWTQQNISPAWQEAARQISAAKGLGLAENARLFALLNMGMANTFINDWDAKFTYNFWRPVTAIRNGDQDGNDATERDAGWTSAECDADAPRVSLAGGDRGRFVGSDTGTGGRGSGEHAVHGHRPCRPETDAQVHQHHPTGKRAVRCTRLGRNPFQEFARGRRRHGAQDVRLPGRELAQALAVSCERTVT